MVDISHGTRRIEQTEGLGVFFKQYKMAAESAAIMMEWMMKMLAQGKVPQNSNSLWRMWIAKWESVNTICLQRSAPAYQSSDVLCDYKTQFRKEEYFYGKDRAHLAVYFAVTDRTASIDKILSLSQPDVPRTELARILSLFLYGYVTATETMRALNAFYESNRPPMWSLVHYRRFIYLKKFIAAFTAICLRESILDSKLNGLQRGDSQQPANVGHAEITQERRDALFLNQTPQKVQLNSLFHTSAHAAGQGHTLRSMDDYMKHYQSGLADEVTDEGTLVASCPGYVQPTWPEQTKQEAAIG